jgi:hypothetical protein
MNLERGEWVNWVRQTRDPGYETEITFYKKKQLDLIEVKMPKLANLIIKPIYHHKKQIKTDYEA